MPDLLGLFDDLTDAAAKAVADVFNGAMKAIWTFASLLLTGAFGIIDKYTTPDLNPTTGPLAGLFQQTLWIGVLIAVVMGFVQTGRAVMQGGRGFGRLFIGIGQYAVVTVAGLGILDTAVVASNQLSSSVLQTGLNIKDWKGINGQNSFFQDAVNIPSGVALGLVALLCVIPAAIGYLLEALVREARSTSWPAPSPSSPVDWSPTRPAGGSGPGCAGCWRCCCFHRWWRSPSWSA